MTADRTVIKGWNSKMAVYGCRRCHRLGGEGNGLAADLDYSARKRTPEELAAAIKTPVKAMPDFSFTEATVADTVTALLAFAERSGQPKAANRQIVHFESSGGAKEDVFSKKCGGCHRALTSRYGAIGRGDTAPNLSGLLSPYYPGRYSKEARWDMVGLEKWLLNPRKVRRDARMQPVDVSTKEFKDLKKMLQID